MNLKLNKNILIIIGYALVSIISFAIINALFLHHNVKLSGLLNWDAAHYNTIKETGYAGNDIAFFPLFPMTWKLLHLGPLGISIFNGILYLGSFYFLISQIQTNYLQVLAYLTIPSAIFYFLPYSESVFFASSVLIVIGLKHDKLSLVLIGLFFSSLARPAFSVFFPAIMIAEFLSSNNYKKILIRLSVYGLVLLAGMLLVAFIQYMETGRWFEFFTVQKDWGSKLQFPKFPLTSWAGGMITRLDAAAMIIGIVSGLIILFKIFKIKPIRDVLISKEVIFSLAYLGGMTLSVLAFRGGSLHSLNRFIFAVPLIIVGFNFFMNQPFSISNKQLALIALILIVFSTCFGSYVHIMNLLKFVLFVIYLLLLVALKHRNPLISKGVLLLFILTSYIFQIFFYFRFLQGGWIA